MHLPENFNAKIKAFSSRFRRLGNTGFSLFRLTQLVVQLFKCPEIMQDLLKDYD